MTMKSIGLKVLILPLSLALVVMISVIYISPASKEMNTNRKVLAERKDKLAALQTQTRKLNELKSTFESLEERKIVAVAIPEDVSAEDYLSELYQRASRSGVLVNNFSVSESSSGGEQAYICGAQATGPEASSVAASPGSGASSENLSGSVSPAPTSCVDVSSVQVSTEGSWDQFLGFYKYLADSNRIANVTQVAINPKNQSASEGSSSDFLASTITLDVFYRPKSGKSNLDTIGALAGGAGFNQGILKKLKEVVYAPYEEPVVSETGERNFFK